MEGTTEESPAQKQARIRRERREAKIKAGGSARLDKITSLSGRPSEPTPTAASAFQTPSVADDPEEVDISTHSYAGARSSTFPNGSAEADMRELLRSSGPMPDMHGNPFGMPGQPGQSPFMNGPNGDGDPMIQMLQQIMGGGMPGGAGQGGFGSGGGDGGLPPGLAAMMGAGGEEVQVESKSGYIWKIIHALFALALGIYATATLSFNGDKIARTPHPNIQDPQMRIFWVFTTAELVLQSTRFFVERGKIAQGGILASVVNFLPMPWKGYVQLVVRYSGIYMTVVEDAMVVIFVLGAVAWWKGTVA